jgi:hypothetical protein
VGEEGRCGENVKILRGGILTFHNMDIAVWPLFKK